MIASAANPTIKHIRALSQRKTRVQTGSFFIEGIRIVAEAVELGAEIEAVVVAPELLTSDFGQQVVKAAVARGARLIEVERRVFESLSAREGPQGVGAVVRQRWHKLSDIAPGEELCWVALESPQDPGNIGTILRTCDAVGAAGVILVGDAADPYDPGALRASMGALFALRLARAGFEEFARWRRERGFVLIGTSDAAPQDYRAYPYRRPLIVLMGSEREGLSPEQQTACDAMVSIPMVGRSDSLNLAVATGVLLYEVFAQLGASNRRRLG